MATDLINPISNIGNISGTVSLPTGAATSANQTTANSSLSSIDGKLPALGQALSGASIPVVLPATQITALTPPSTVAISSLPSLPAGSNAIGSITNTSFAATQSGTWNITNISGTVSLPTGAATSANQTTANTSLSSIDTKLPSGLTVTSTRLLIDGSGVTQPVSAASLPLPMGAAISANQIPVFTVSAKTLGTANAATVKASAGKVYSLSATNLNASVRYLQIVNKATTPTNSDSASIVDVWTIPANGTIIIDSPYYGANGLSCGTGVSWAFSSTATTITLATAGDCLVSVGYV